LFIELTWGPYGLPPRDSDLVCLGYNWALRIGKISQVFLMC
jgi:hypothetical protein